MAKVGVATISLSGIDDNDISKATIYDPVPPEPISIKKIIINVSGQSFVSTSTTLLKYPDTKLGKLVRQQPTRTNYFFESDADIFKEILKFYRNNELHCPKNICYSDFLTHLAFWEIDARLISNCCVQEVKEESDLDRQFEYFDRRLKYSGISKGSCCTNSYMIWCFLTDPYGPDTKCKTASKVWALCYLLLTIFSGTSLAVFTMPSIWLTPETNSTDFIEDASRFPHLNSNFSCRYFRENWLDILPAYFRYTNMFCLLVYIIEIWTRFITCPDKRKFWKTINGVDMIISLFEAIFWTISLFGVFVVVPNADQFKNSGAWCMTAFSAQMIVIGMGQLRYLRLLSYASVYSGLKILLITLYRSWKEILLLVALLTMSVLIFGPLIYFTALTSMDEEGAVLSVPAAYWFVIVTMTTVGYGDMYPSTFSGYLVTMVVMVVGLTITALPIAIVGGNFALVHEHHQKREKEMMRRENEDKLAELSIPSSSSSLQSKNP